MLMVIHCMWSSILLKIALLPHLLNQPCQLHFCICLIKFDLFGIHGSNFGESFIFGLIEGHWSNHKTRNKVYSLKHPNIELCNYKKKDLILFESRVCMGTNDPVIPIIDMCYFIGWSRFLLVNLAAVFIVRRVLSLGGCMLFSLSVLRFLLNSPRVRIFLRYDGQLFKFCIVVLLRF